MSKSTTIGEYIIDINDEGSVYVYKIPRSARAALRECAEKQGLDVDEKENTQSLGQKLLRNYCGGESIGTIGEYHIERAANGHIDVLVEYKNTIGALREFIRQLEGLEWSDKWNTREAGRKIVDYTNAHPESILKKAPCTK